MGNEQETLKLASQYYKLGNLIEAERLYKQILEGNPDDAAVLYSLGLIACQSRRKEVGAEYFEKAAKINPCIDYCRDLANLLFDLNRKDEAVCWYKKALELRPNDIDIYFNLGLLYGQNDNTEEAIKCFENVINVNANDFEAYNNLGDIYLKANEFDKALENYQKALHLRPDCAETYLKLGILFTQKNKLEEAIICYKKALELKPAYTEAQNNLQNLCTEATI